MHLCFNVRQYLNVLDLVAIERPYVCKCDTKPFIFWPPASRAVAHQHKPAQPSADGPDYRVLPNATIKPPTTDAASEAESLYWCRQ